MDVVDGARGVDVVVGGGVPASADEVALAGVVLGTIVVVLWEQAAMTMTPARIHMQRTRRGYPVAR
jgi:hypothetical protein